MPYSIPLYLNEPVAMLVPNPHQVTSATIGGKEVDQLSELSEFINTSVSSGTVNTKYCTVSSYITCTE